MTLRIHPDEIVAASPRGLLGVHPTWERVRLGQIATILNGFAFPSSGFSTSGTIPLIRIRDVGSNGTSTWFTGSYDETYVVTPGSLLVGMDGDFRVDRWVGPAALLNQRVCKMTVRDDRLYSERFLRWVLPGYLDAVHRHTSSVTVKHLSSETLKELPIPLPPREEQDRIVEAIEEQFSRLDAGLMALERSRANLSRLRAAVMQSQLSPGSNAERHDNEQHPTGWSWHPLGEIVERLRNGIFVSRPGVDPTDRPILRISAVRPMALNMSDVRYVHQNRQLANAEEYLVQPGDLLFTRYSGNPEYVGACAMVPVGAPSVLYPDKLIRVQVDRAMVEPRFVELAAATGATRRDIRGRVKTTAGQTGISGSDLKSVLFPVPSLEVQRQIIQKVDSVLPSIGHLGDSVLAQEGHADVLRSAILSAAFSGGLVAQAPQEEPASVLLEHIAASQKLTDDGSPIRTRKPRNARSRVTQS